MKPLELTYATDTEARLLEACTAIHQKMINDSIDLAGARGPICIVHAALHMAAQVCVQRAMPKEAFQQLIDLAWSNALKHEAERCKAHPDA